MIERLVLFGATGDLTARYLLPALAALHEAGQLGAAVRLTGVSREDMDSADYRAWIAEQLERHGGTYPATARDAVVAMADYRRTDVTDPAAVADAVAGEGPSRSTSPCPRRCSPASSPPCTRPACRPGAGSCWRSRSARTWPGHGS
ncbi:hypothetical protein ACU686_10960 [Yinghuangia aomiensis]